jgi:type I restriction enzyme R subunit
VVPGGGSGPEWLARQKIDASLAEAGWVVQDRADLNLDAGRGVAVREFPLASGHGHVDYLLFVDGKACGVLEAKPDGHSLTGVEPQAQKYATGLPSDLETPVRPLPFVYISTGEVTRFSNLLDPEPRSRPVFAFHRPETLADWLDADPLGRWASGWLDQVAEKPAADGFGTKPASLRARLRVMPPVHIPGLWKNKVEAITNLEKSFFDDRPRALIQMATGSGKTLLAITAIYRLIKYAGARRVLFLVDRKNLGEQAEKEFAGYRTPDDQRKFTELYKVQRLESNKVGSSSKVVITTIQRLYSMLRGEEELDPALETGSLFDHGEEIPPQPVAVDYNSALPIEYFDVIFIDECHRSIYSLWRQVLEYFDAHLIGLTATPAKHTFGFFNQNLVMEYGHEKAVADGVNVDFEVYRIRTRISEEGSTIEAGPATVVGVRDRQTRSVRWQRPDEDISYDSSQLDRGVVAKDQIRLIVRTFKERLRTEIFPDRKEVPKTLIFAKDDSHAEDIVEIVREEFGKGNEFAQKITYKTTGKKPSDLIQDFRNSFYPRIAVTVDMIATGTDIKPIEIVMFMRAVKSKLFFEQMKGRGVRVIDRDELQAVTPDAYAKTHFVIVDCVGICEQELSDTQPLDRERKTSFKDLLEHVAAGGTHPDKLSSLASRLARLDRECDGKERGLIREASGGIVLADITHGIVMALDPDEQIRKARERFALPPDQEPTEDQRKAAVRELCRDAVKPLAAIPALRKMLVEIKRRIDQIIDEISRDELKEAGFSEAAKETARGLVESFEKFLKDNRDELDALQFFYSQPYGRRLRYKDIRDLAHAIEAPPRFWTTERIWRAYETLTKDKVRCASGPRLLADVVSLVRFALKQEDQLIPYPEVVQIRYEKWLGEQKRARREFTPGQMRWLEMIRDHIATSLEIGVEDFELSPFDQEGGLGRAGQVFGVGLKDVMAEMNEVLVG